MITVIIIISMLLATAALLVTIGEKDKQNKDVYLAALTRILIFTLFVLSIYFANTH